MDVYLTTAPWTGVFNGTLPAILIKPAAVGAAVGTAISILIFPESCSHAAMAQVIDFFKPCMKVLQITQESLKTFGENLNEQDLNTMKRGLIALHEKSGQSYAFLPLEPSYGRWSAEDIQSTRPHIRLFLIRLIAVLNFHILRVEIRDKRYTHTHHDLDDQETDEKGIHRKKKKPEPPRVGKYQTLAVSCDVWKTALILLT